MVKEPVRKIRIRATIDTTTAEFADILLAINKITKTVIIVEEVVYLDKDEVKDEQP